MAVSASKADQSTVETIKKQSQHAVQHSSRQRIRSPEKLAFRRFFRLSTLPKRYPRPLTAHWRTLTTGIDQGINNVVADYLARFAAPDSAPSPAIPGAKGH